MYIIGVDDREDLVFALEDILEKLDPGGEHRFYTDPLSVTDDLDKPVEVAFLETQMPGMSGIELAKKITDRYPLCNIIFLTEHADHMREAFEIHASGYIMKPASSKKIDEALSHLRYRTPHLEDRPLKVQCFGSFEVFVHGEPVVFKRKKSKEVLAYLIDRRGALCTVEMMVGNIEPNSISDTSTGSKIRVYIGDLIVTFLRLGIKDLIVKSYGNFEKRIGMK